jgi:hypothetical protein
MYRLQNLLFPAETCRNPGKTAKNPLATPDHSVPTRTAGVPPASYDGKWFKDKTPFISRFAAAQAVRLCLTVELSGIDWRL